jgi:hypothetical protein
MALINTNTVGIDVYDFTGNKTLSTYALEETPLTFVPNFTLNELISSVSYVSALCSYTLTFGIPDPNNYSNVKLRWDFSDGTYQIAPTAVHSFKYPGEYKVSLYLINENGESYKTALQATINSQNYLIDKIYFERPLDFVIDIPAGRLSDKITLKRVNSYQSYNLLSGTGYTFNLYASGTGSYYYDPENYYKDKWGHLKKFYKFVKKVSIGNVLQDEIVNSVTTDNTKLYVKKTPFGLIECNASDDGAIFVGTSGLAEFYYTDDSNKNNVSDAPPVIVFASLDVSKFYDFMGYTREMYDTVTPLELSYLNFAPAVLPIIKTRYNPASILTITTNGLDGEGSGIIDSFNLSPVSYTNTKIPFVIKLKDQDNFTTKSYPYLSATDSFPVSSYYIKTVLIDDTGTIVPSVSFYPTNFEKEIFKSGGFYRGYFVAGVSVLNAKLSSIAYINDIPNFEQDTIFLLYSQPYTNYLGKYYSNYFYSSCKDEPSKVNNIYEFINTVDCRSVFTITQIPSSNNEELDYSFWAADSDTDKLLKFDYTGTLLNTINLSSVTSAYSVNGTQLSSYNNFLNSWDSAAPTCIALDGDNNIWVTLFDSGSVIKLDNNGFLKAVIPPPVTLSYISSTDYYTNYGFAGENNVTPSYVDVDKNNNVFVVYSSPVYPAIEKYSSTGELLCSYGFNIFSESPQKVIVDRNNDVWLTVYNEDNATSEIEDRNDTVYKFNNELNLLFSVTGLRLPGDITVDGNQNLWVTDGKSSVTKILNNGSNTYTFRAGSFFNLTNYMQSIEGISCNSQNQIVILNNTDLKIYFIDALTTEQPNIENLPQVNLTSAPTNFVTYPISSFYDSKYQADGDFLGYKWINKYYYFSKNTRYINGTSKSFNVYPETGNNLMFKDNENFDGTKFYKDLALMQTLQDNPGLFDKFIGTIVGNKTSDINSALLSKIFEKISNFNGNISDVDICNIESLVSKCEMFDVTYDKFNYPYPPSLRRVLDLCSISRNKLIGTSQSFSQLFRDNTNLGNLMSLETDTFSGSEYLVAKEKFSSTYHLVNTNLINGVSSTELIHLSGYNYYWGWNLVVPQSLSGIDIGSFYEFYRYIPNNSEIFDNLIDYNSERSNLASNLSSLTSYNDWYGDNGILDQNIMYTFIKGLRLFTSATNVYNN